MASLGGGVFLWRSPRRCRGVRGQGGATKAGSASRQQCRLCARPCSSHYMSVSSNDSLINNRPWSKDQEKGLVKLNPFHVIASPGNPVTEQGLSVAVGRPRQQGKTGCSGHPPGQEDASQRGLPTAALSLLLTGASCPRIVNSGTHCRAVPWLSCVELVLGDWVPQEGSWFLAGLKNHPETQRHTHGL